MERKSTVQPCTLVLFGASGDLTKRKLIPALYSLFVAELLPDNLAIVGFSRRDLTFLADMKKAVLEFGRYAIDEDKWTKFSEKLSYVAGDFSDPGAYDLLRAHLEELDRVKGTQGNRVFYIATPPAFFGPIMQQLESHELLSHADKPYTRVIIEKPFGKDLDSAQELQEVCTSILRENQLYLIDHYLGKESVQNLLLFRLANQMIAPLWNCDFIDHVEITVAESIGIEGRGAFYDQTGALRDMIQNHLLQLLSLTAMEPPSIFDDKEIHQEKVNVLRSLRYGDAAGVGSSFVRAQYSAGDNAQQSAVGYLQEPDVKSSSRTETYVAAHVHIDMPRWKGVPFYLRAGKHLKKRVAEVAITFKATPHQFAGSKEPNVLVFRLQPDADITAGVLSKTAGPGFDATLSSLRLNQQENSFGELKEAYERLLLDALLGDKTLFATPEEALAAWQFCSPILEFWKEQDERGEKMPVYEAYSWGPREAEGLLAKQNHQWRKPE